ncbi:SHOCT domain-containing protein [Hymenobacter rubripertinctus]|uniref:SHOCT domain-containing protein n=1 Tax=Hymenobacter rubripertinctus TaxID=2029981 RepID=A0A418RA26_9BACT|nr:SHOCT domain-containing protein [Hymenobacter rubripertinctus]RIY14135.1 SHOCT domain-containing protein [Hymenobacter rubripertinctus]
MEKDPSPLDTLRQLKEWLDAGTITPEEFQTLKQKLVFTDAAPGLPPDVSPIARETPPPVPEPPVPELPVTIAAPVAVMPPAFPTPPAPTATIAPISEPLLPPLTRQAAPDSSAGAVPPAPPVTGPGFSHPLEAGRPPASPGRADEFLTPAPAPGPPQEYVEDETYVVPPKSSLGTILVVAGIVALLALIVYLMTGNQASERLTSATITAADSVATRPDEGPQTEQIELPPVAAPETIRVTTVPPVEVAATPDAAEEPELPPAPEAAPPEAPPVSDANAEARVTGVLQRYYTDLQASPFTAAAYFAPQVERFYLMRNTTPAAINAELEKTHFPEFLEGQSSIRPGSLQISAPVADGSRVVTYVENSTALRQSLQKHQQTAAQVRVRFDKNFKIVYLRQEKLLENNFSD